MKDKHYRTLEVKPVPYSSVTGSSVAINFPGGPHIGQLLFVGFELERADMERLAKDVSSALARSAVRVPVSRPHGGFVSR